MYGEETSKNCGLVPARHARLAGCPLWQAKRLISLPVRTVAQHAAYDDGPPEQRQAPAVCC